MTSPGGVTSLGAYDSGFLGFAGLRKFRASGLGFGAIDRGRGPKRESRPGKLRKSLQHGGPEPYDPEHTLNPKGPKSS